MVPNLPPSFGEGERSVASCGFPRASIKLTTSTLAVFALALASAAPAHAKPDGPYGKGNLAKGEVKVMLNRGAVVPFELTVMATPNNCEGHMELTVSWDEDDNEVVLRLEGDEVLTPHPTVERTLGVDYTPNAFFPEPEDYTNGRYQLWVLGAGPITMFYYDPSTLDLMGSQHDFEVPPPAIPVFLPTQRMFATDLFQPDEDGDVDLTWTFDYDGLVRADRPEFSHHLVTFPPTNLCGVNPNRLDLSTLRPYLTKPFPAADAMSWSDYLRGGLLFDLTIEPPDYYVDPPSTSLAATYSGGTAVGGGVPRGWNVDIDAVFMNVAPPIRPWAGAGSCENIYPGLHTTGLNVCGGAP